MLTSDASDLIGSCSDMEADKGTAHELEGDNDDVDSPS